MKKLIIFLISIFLINNNQLFSAALSSQQAHNDIDSNPLSLDEPKESKSKDSLDDENQFKILYFEDLEKESTATTQLWSILRKNINENNKITNDKIDVKAVEEAINLGANLNTAFKPSDFKNTIFMPLDIAMNANNTELAKLFLNKAKGLIAQLYKKRISNLLNANEANEYNDRVVAMPTEIQIKMYELFFERYPELIKELEDKNELDNLTGFYSRIPNPALFDLVIKHGANINKVALGGNTPLMHAAQNNNANMIKALLKAGASIYFENNVLNHYKSLLKILKRFRHEEAREAYYESFSQATKQLWQILKNNIYEHNEYVPVIVSFEINNPISSLDLKRVIDAGADLNSVIFIAEDKYFEKLIFSPLLVAVRSDDYVATQMLINNNPSNFQIIDMVDEDGDTALMVASQRNKIDIVLLLLHAGADVNIKNAKTGKSFLKLIEEEGFEEVKKAYGEFLKFVEDRKAKLMAVIPTLPNDLANLINQYEYFQKPIENQEWSTGQTGLTGFCGLTGSTGQTGLTGFAGNSDLI